MCSTVDKPGLSTNVDKTEEGVKSYNGSFAQYVGRHAVGQ